jgi:hypothetical protein
MSRDEGWMNVQKSDISHPYGRRREIRKQKKERERAAAAALKVTTPFSLDHKSPYRHIKLD